MYFRNLALIDIDQVEALDIDHSSHGRDAVKAAVLHAGHAESQGYAVAIDDAVELGKVLVGKGSPGFRDETHKAFTVQSIPGGRAVKQEAGGEDLADEGDTWEIITDPHSFEAVAQAVRDAGIETVMSEITMIASTYTKLEGPAAASMVRLLEALEDHDDVQHVYSNFDIDAKQLEEVTS